MNILNDPRLIRKDYGARVDGDEIIFTEQFIYMSSDGEMFEAWVHVPEDANSFVQLPYRRLSAAMHVLEDLCQKIRDKVQRN